MGGGEPGVGSGESEVGSGESGVGGERHADSHLPASRIPRPAPPIPDSPLPTPCHLLDRFPALASLPRAALATLPSPVERLVLPGDGELWVKRDDLDAAEFGGNKVRALEFLLGAVRPGDRILTLGGEGSTHVLATAVHGARLGARVTAVRWPHEMTPLARRVARLAEARAERIVHARSVVEAFARMALLRWSAHRETRRGGPRTHYVPIGGSSPLGVLGHVEGGLELASQVAAGLLPAPARVVIPLGSCGTAAGLALGFAIAGLETTVVGARVGPRLAVTRRRTLRLAEAAARLIERKSGARVPRPRADRVVVDHDVYGGAYGRPLAAGEHAAALLREAGALTLDATYSEKAAAAAVRLAGAAPGPTLFWLTFDGRGLTMADDGELASGAREEKG